MSDLNERPSIAEADALRRSGFIDWFAKREASGYRRADLMKDAGISKGRVSQLFNPDETFGEGAARGIENAYELGEGYFLEAGKLLKRTKREISTPGNVGMPGKDGHTTTVNLTTNEVKQGSILPLLPWNRVELMLLPNDRSEIVELPDAPRVPLFVDWDPGMAKVIEMPNSSLGRPAKGDYLIFDPSLTADRTHIPDQLVLARTPGGAHLIRRYDAADMESKQQAVVCWCEQWYPPKNT